MNPIQLFAEIGQAWPVVEAVLEALREGIDRNVLERRVRELALELAKDTMTAVSDAAMRKELNEPE